MMIELKKFGEMLTSRPSGREAFLALQPTLKDLGKNENLEINFEGVRVFTPSWADEFITPLMKRYGDRIKLGASKNLSVKETLKFLNEISLNSKNQ